MSLQTIYRTCHIIVAAMLWSGMAAGQNESASPSAMLGGAVGFNLKRAPAEKQHAGALSVDRQFVSYSEMGSVKKTQTLACSEFLSGVSMRQDKGESVIVLPSKWGGQALWPDRADGLSVDDILRRIKAECATPGSSRELAYSEGISYQIVWMEHGAGRGRFKRSEGSVSVRRFSVRYSDKKYSARSVDYSCANTHLIGPRNTKDCNDCLVIDGKDYSFRPAERTLASGTMLQGVKDACSSQEAGHRKELEEEAHRELVRQEAEARRRAEESARRVVEFRDAIRTIVRSAQETDPFSSIRSGLDPNGPGGHYWRPTLQLPGAERCALASTPTSTRQNVVAWAFACRFTSGWPSASDFGEEPMAKSVEAALGLPRTKGDPATNKQVFFSDPTTPTWRLYVARIDDGTVGVSIVTAQPGIAQTGSAAVGGIALAPMMLLVDSRCQEYKAREDERSRRQFEIKTTETELNDLQRRYQNALTEAMAADQRATSNCSGGTGFLGSLKAVACFADRTTSQEKRAEAQQLTFTINQKQSQMTSAQVSLVTLPPSLLPSGCRTDGTTIVAVPGASDGGFREAADSSVSAIVHSSPLVGISVSAQPTVHDSVEKIRSGRYEAIPVAQRVVVDGPGGSGSATMTVTNSTPYELTVYFDGPISTKVAVLPGGSRDVNLVSGTFHLAGRVTADDVLPFYGEDTYVSSAKYAMTFHIMP